MAVRYYLELRFLLLCIECIFTELHGVLGLEAKKACNQFSQSRMLGIGQTSENESPRTNKYKKVVVNEDRNHKKCITYVGDCIERHLQRTSCHQYTNGVLATKFSFHIFGGTEATCEEFPYTVALGYRDKSKLPVNAIKFICGGTIITDKFILTAAHCVNNIDQDIPILVRAGTSNLLEHKEAQTVEIAEIISHPNYRRSRVYNDIALIKLLSKLKWTRTVKPICLMSTPMGQIEMNSNVSFIVTGWGATDINAKRSTKLMRTPSLELVPSTECRESYTKSRHYPYDFDDKILCAIDSDSSRRADAYYGDSGGPLLMIDTQGDTIIGVTSFGQNCGTRAPGVYTSVYRYLDWIEASVWPDHNSADPNGDPSSLVKDVKGLIVSFLKLFVEEEH